MNCCSGNQQDPEEKSKPSFLSWTIGIVLIGSFIYLLN